MKTVRFIATGPPTADAGSFWGIVDDEGQPVSVGWWQHNGAQWEYVMPVRMVPELIVPNVDTPIAPRYVEPQIEAAYQKALASAKTTVIESPLQRQRRELKERVRAAPKKAAPVEQQQAAAEVPANWEKCPSCGEPFDPQKDELMDCARCSESKCTRKCLPNIVEPCTDCQALQPDPHEEAYAAAPPAGALFSGKQINDPETMRKLGAAAVAMVEDEGDEDE